MSSPAATAPSVDTNQVAPVAPQLPLVEVEVKNLVEVRLKGGEEANKEGKKREREREERNEAHGLRSLSL